MAAPREIDALPCGHCRKLDRRARGGPRCKATGDAITEHTDVEPCLGAEFEPRGFGRPTRGRLDAKDLD